MKILNQPAVIILDCPEMGSEFNKFYRFETNGVVVWYQNMSGSLEKVFWPEDEQLDKLYEEMADGSKT